MLRLYAYEEQYQDDLIRFLKKCLPQSEVGTKVIISLCDYR